MSKKELKVTIGGLPVYSQVLNLADEVKSDANPNDLGFEYGEFEQGEVGGYFEKQIIDAGDKGSYQYTLATASNSVKNKGIDWSKYPNFSESEFTCNCGKCGKPKIKEDIVIVLQAMRDAYGKPMRINSAYRCLNYNRSIGSKDTSSHVKGLAVDILTPTIHDRFILEGIARDCGVRRIGTYDNMFIHIDVDNGKTQDVHWLG